MERKNRIEVKLENKEQIHKIAWLVGSANVQQIEGQIKKVHTLYEQNIYIYIYI